jgi:1-acyl-sn-glycerol-3-phosphate acyltransferase
VRHWPLFGHFASLSGACFINRERPGDVGHCNASVLPLLRAGQVIMLFAEGTSSDGQGVLPFYSSLLAPAVESGCLATPAWVGYALEDGRVENEVCYWRDMVLLPHLLNLLTKRAVRACVIFGDSRPAGNDRKQLARSLHSAVQELRKAGVGLMNLSAVRSS